MKSKGTTITELQGMMNVEQARLEDAFLHADLRPIFDDHYVEEAGSRALEKIRRRGRRRQEYLGCDLMDRACRVLADARLREDLPLEIRRAAEILTAAGYLGL